MDISEICELPTLFNDVKTGKSHESVLRAFQILFKVKDMLRRGDSAKTILEVIDLCENTNTDI
jgi:hypothetical protein